MTIEEKTTEFVASLDGVCRPWVTDSFLVSFLANGMLKCSQKYSDAPMSILAYSMAYGLFRYVFERDLGADLEAETVARKYAAYFENIATHNLN